ncbi:hypothetical protein EQK42_00635 [Streptomyces albidoflavus]|uniref:hypothetical protein n=1 Tax=Streptomyces albidoflavus TaxID=1886 RepID=UPI000FF7143E|nr:hypothetical protein [Streptomyces albidoflavus]RWZ77868.1 hypothetical protein EQK42_00635 [Streptomyces albidoflavus]
MSQRRQFTINVEPHVAEIGDTELLFQPEVMGDEFLDAYEDLQETQKRLGVDVNDLAGVEPEKLRLIVASLRVFLARLMLPESADEFLAWDVVKAGKVVDSYPTEEEAEARAAKLKDAAVRVGGMRLPDRVLVQLLEWAVELYGGGSRPTTSSTGSAAASPPPGTRGRAVSRSKGSTRTGGR